MASWIEVWLIGLAAAAALMTGVWVLSVLRRDASVVDIFWGAAFVMLSWIYFVLGDGLPARKWLAVSLVSVWGLRLSLHILWRSLGSDEDYRYRQMRDKHGDRFAWVSLFTVFLLQAGLLWLISAPLLEAQTISSDLGWTDALGVALFGIGFFFETVGDLQLARFRADPDNRGKVLCTGLWRYTRHPNYFGDAAVWWGFLSLALADLADLRVLWLVYSPLLMTFFLRKVSGVALLEKKLMRTRPGYREYAERTNAFFPWFPRQSTGARDR